MTYPKRARDEFGVGTAEPTAEPVRVNEELRLENTERKRTEEALSLFRTLVDQSNDGVEVIDPDTLQILDMNQKGCADLGYTREEILSLTLRDIDPTMDHDECVKAITQLKESGTLVKEGVHLRKNGSTFPVEVSTKLIGLEGGKFVVAMVRDITERKRVEGRLREYEKAVEGVEEMIAVVDRNYRLLLANRAYAQFRNIERDQLLGRLLPEVIDKEFFERVVKEKLDECFRGKIVKYELRHNYPGIGQKDLLVSYFPIQGTSGVDRAVCVLRDITERKRVEERLREYEKAVEGVEEMVAVVDRNYRYLLANRAYAQFRNLKQEQVVGRLVTEVVNKDFFEQVVKEKLDASFQGKIVKFELRYSFPEIGERDLFVSYFPIHGIDGVDRVVCITRDITDQKRVEEEFKRLSGQLLLSQDEERRRIARDLHDATGQDLVALATMLGRLRAFLPAKDRKSRRFLSECKTLANECIREVRTLSYIVHPPALDQEGLEDAIRDYALGFAIRSGILVELELSPRLGRLPREVELALFRVVQESLTNIQRHSGSRRAKIRIQCDSDLTLEISDDGPEASACVPRGNEKPRFKFGVGIPSMRERVNLIGGRLDIDSTNKGTTIRVRIPLQGSARENTSHSGS
jgi:PAS domain S-box-containing protein